MSQQVEVCADLPKDPGSITITHWVPQKHLQFQFHAIQQLLLASMVSTIHMGYISTDGHTMHIVLKNSSTTHNIKDHN